MIEIYTDGACRGNPGPGDWGTTTLRQAWKRFLGWSRTHHQQPHGNDSRHRIAENELLDDLANRGIDELKNNPESI